MAIDIFWATTKRIFVPRADMSIVQASPEIRELNVDTFRKALKDLEAAAEGMPWPDTHRHNGEVVLSGITYARFVTILAPYTVEFEDGQYGVRTVGANHNILDVKIANQVSLLTQNSAGLTTPGFTTADQTTLTNIDLRSGRLVKVLENKLEVDFGAQELVLYDNDGVTVLQRWALNTGDGSLVAPKPGVQTKRGMPQL